MKLAAAFGLAFVAILATSTFAEEIDPLRVTLDYFPYCICQNGTAGDTAYKLDNQVVFKGNNTYCFKVLVNIPPNCKGFCCNADLNKLEFDVNPECKVAGQVLAGTVNGKVARPVPTVEKSVDADTNTFIFKLTGMGLNTSTANNAEICVYLGPSKSGQACTSLTAMCKPPPGAPKGVCRTALFDSTIKCCPLTDVGLPQPPPSPPPPKPPSPPPPPPPCKSCITVQTAPLDIIKPYNFSQQQCSMFADKFIADLTNQSAKVGAVITVPFTLTECAPTYFKVCGEFRSDADGAKLQTWAESQVLFWAELITGKTSVDGQCFPEFVGYTVRVQMGGDCLDATAVTQCTTTPTPPAFPKCSCNRAVTSLVFKADGSITEVPGRFNNVTLFCFDISTVDPLTVKGPCKESSTLLKAEIFADEKYRRGITATAIKPAGASSYKYLASSWGAFGESTYKVSPLNWSIAQANGGQICLELLKPLTVSDFCAGNVVGFRSRCWLSLFDVEKKCCPLSYSTV